MTPTLPRDEWQARRRGHVRRLSDYCADRAARTSARRLHPVDDFLFEYYGVPPARLLRWSPGVGVVLEGAMTDELDWGRLFQPAPGGLVMSAESFPARRRPFLTWALDYLQAVGNRAPAFGCFGLHEWAMVYRTPAVRHATTPLRLSPADIASVVESSELRCTHFDAYRFFTPAAAPRNRLALSRAATADHDQPACVHVTMDLFKYAYKLGPWCPAEVTADAFLLAREARTLDMRASPYDLSGYRLPPIHVETRTGRDEYAASLKQLMGTAATLRQRLYSVYSELVTATPHAHEQRPYSEMKDTP